MIRHHAHITSRNWFAILTIIKRAIIRYKTFGWFLISQNIGSILLFILILKLISFSSPGDSLLSQSIDFKVVLPGLFIFAAINHCFTEPIGGIIYDKLEHINQDIYMSPMDAHDVILSFLASTMTMLVVQLIPLWGILYFFGLTLIPVNAALSIFIIFISAILISIIAIVVGLFSQKWDHFSMAVTFFFLPLSAFSGCFFPVSALPDSIRQILSWNILARIVETFRSAWLGTVSPYNLNYTLLVIVFLFVIAYSIAYRIISKRLRLV